jgi:hypothetical protein
MLAMHDFKCKTQKDLIIAINGKEIISLLVPLVLVNHTCQ